ncbi:molecular chaperone [Erythrobacter sp. KY5]|uniref:ATP12 family chaperone protein n=1 Tax=Erythrobacter sp. KY5 TaxID=2011159 RepID=UPI000DBF171F|nr:ATP12 family protein [Erythrobacter sp. KY5]AWW73905.1 molecular chaperone [Erythrobacter sp. KY5]
MKRFYKSVDTQQAPGGWQVTLDGRGLRTQKGAGQIVPTQALASALAAEWDAQGDKIDPASLPFRDMADYALDIVADNPAAHADKVLTYGDTDTLLYRADPDEPLYSRQQEIWEPIAARFEKRHGIELVRVSGIVHRPQSEATLAKLREALGQQTPFALSGIEAMTSLAASLMVALEASEPDADALALWQAASLEEEWQAELWGRDEEAEERRVRREAAFLKAREFVRLAVAD